jgi:hypothetical protein
MMNAKSLLMIGGAALLMCGGVSTAGTPETSAAAVAALVSYSPRIWVDANVGTLGAGASISVNLCPSVRMRLRGAMLSYEEKELWSDMDSQMKIYGDNIGLLFDYFPGEEKNFYISAGLNFGENRMRCRATADGPAEINFGGTEYSLQSQYGEISGKYTWNHVNPYIGIGYQDSLWEGSSFYYSVDLGISFIGDGKLTVSSKGHWRCRGENYQMSDATDEQFRQSIRREGRDFFKIADDLCVYPVLQFSIGARF